MPADGTEDVARTPGSGRRARTAGVLAGLLAVAVAVPAGVHLIGSEAAPRPARPRQDASGPLGAAEAVRRAKKTGELVEVTRSRTENVTVWAQPNGRLKAKVHSSAVRAKSGGAWKPIDTGLRRVRDGFAPKAVNGELVFSGGGDTSSTRLVRLTTEGHTMTVTWPGRLPAPVIDGPRALYENVRPGIDLVMTAQDGGYAHVLVVKDRKAAADPLLKKLDYRLASTSLAFRLDAASGALSARDKKGREIAGAGSPLMWDSSGRAGTVGDTDRPGTGASAPTTRHPTLALPGLAGAEGARTSVAKAALADGVLSLKPDRALLDSPATRYPVFVDPSFKGHKHSWSHLYK
ncbi:hypothetical protein ACFW96_38860, partial [Streptomyces gardneri]